MKKFKVIVPELREEYVHVEYEIESNSIEKSILIIYNYLIKIKLMYDNLNSEIKSLILFVDFEKLTQDPEIYVQYICKKTDTIKNNNFSKIMELSNVPRIKAELTVINEIINNHNLSARHVKMIQESVRIYDILKGINFDQ